MKRLLGAFAIIALSALPALPAHAATDPDAYMNTVASHLDDAGVWVDPEVKELTSSEVAELDAAPRRRPLRSESPSSPRRRSTRPTADTS